MKEKHHNHVLTWLYRSLLCLFAAWFFASCIIEKLPLENRLCSAGECLDGWTCVKEKCIKGGGNTEPTKEKDPPDAAPDTKSEPTKEVTQPEPTTPDDGGAPPEPVKEQAPDEPVGPNCSNFHVEAQQDECTKNTGLACYKMSKAFQPSAAALSDPIAGGAVATNGGSAKTINNDKIKVHIYLAGGGNGGSPGTKVFYTEVDRNNVLVSWKLTSNLTKARTNAKAYLIGGYLYVMGGTTTGGATVDSIERAKVNADGSVETFKEIGKLSGVRKGMGVEYRHGYIYLVGGDGSKSVERILLLPDGTLGTQKSLSSGQQLPTGQSGQVVSNHFFLYFVGNQGSNKTYFSRISGDGELLGWCGNSPLPKGTKTSSTYLDGRIMLLFNITKTDGTLDNRIYLSPLKPGTGIPRGGGIQKWICSNASSAGAVLKRARKQSSAIVARGHLYIIGGIDSGNTTLKTTEQISLEYNDPTCNMDGDKSTNFQDNCAKTYNPNQSNLCDTSMQLIPAGSFQRGDGKSVETPKKTIQMDAFFVDKTEVTNAQYKECVTAKQCTAPGKLSSAGIGNYYTDAKYANYPIVHITWKQAIAYCQWKGKRLPTEAEWEKSGRALTNFLYPWGNDSPVCSKANISSCPNPAPKEVGIHPNGASPYSIQNLAGNVREWTQDYYDKNYYVDGKETNNPKGPSSGQTRVVKGSSFKTSGAGAYTISKRGSNKESEGAEDLGFRCAISVYPTAP